MDHKVRLKASKKHMLSSVQDLGSIQSYIEKIDEERGELAVKLHQQQQQEEDLLTQLDSLNEKLSEVAEEISNAKTVEDVVLLKNKYGNLEVLQKLGELFRTRDAKITEKKALKALQQICYQLDNLQGHDHEQELCEVHTKIVDACSHIEDETARTEAYDKFNNLLKQLGNDLVQEFEQQLLTTKWDTQQFVHTEQTILQLRECSSRLFKLNSMLLPHADSNALWNFDCLANNFKIKFIYHFNGSSMQQPQSIEMYFKFLDKYLDQNLCKCISIFQDQEVGLTEALVHQKFINRVLEPIRQKVNSTLMKIAQSNSRESLNTMIVLISQIFINDNALLKKHYYDGVGLVSMIPNNILDVWLAFEIDSTTAQFSKICDTPLNRNGFDLQKLLLNLYAYFEPFYNLDYEKLMDYKFKITRQIFMDLPTKYRQYILNHGDDRPTSFTDDIQFEQTLWKLHNLILIQKLLKEFENKFNFINLTLYFNELMASTYKTVLSDVSNYYEEAIITLKESIVHRIKKMLSASLRVYFKVNEWSNISSQPEQCSAELVGAVNLMKKIFITMGQFDLSADIPLFIKNEVLNIIIHFMVDYVVNLNKFSDMGLKQLMIDYRSLKETLQFEIEQNPQNSEEGAFFENIAILELKHNKPAALAKFTSKKYVEKRDFSQFRKALNIYYSTDSEISSALYRVL